MYRDERGNFGDVSEPREYEKPERVGRGGRRANGRAKRIPMQLKPPNRSNPKPTAGVIGALEDGVVAGRASVDGDCAYEDEKGQQTEPKSILEVENTDEMRSNQLLDGRL